jgi:outer membrane murein-binding lipoprotein Lpp
MKTPIPPLAAPLGAGLLVLTLLGSLPLSGCRSTATTATNPSTVPAAPKAASMTQLSNDLRATRNALDRTTEALERISTSANALTASQTFNQKLNDFEKLSAKSLLRTPNVHETGTGVFNQWEQETQSIQVPAIREIAEQRRQAVQDDYNALRTPLNTALNDLTDVTTLLTDLRKALAMDLTANGISTIQKPLDKARLRSAEFSSSLDTLAQKLDHIAYAIPATSTPPPAPPAK